ncbi:hypothetical protein Saro_1716 [Novosphingobium aromaticivorans DSM 12444]|uniref:Uncharacterized protein n=1 Tax=Novosphingobium aromaticivorans (strain ATCC 700278 / DSM 12444 / CCUG 56034 / CIP 105152 / NBRC 16084 / F199) TaxID=279238 RepID=Q2G7L7_NOVAD|nr:hypothetical protein Saro_1716 [Novosphingobium aromaticivorans DSM 12444]
MNGTIEAPEWRTYRAERSAAGAGCPCKGVSVRDGSHSGVPSGFDQNGHLPRQSGLKYRHIPAPSFLAPGRFASNLDGAIHEFTA